MNGANGHHGQAAPGALPVGAGPGGATAPAAGGWNEYRSADGRVYYHNAATNVTQWTKPEDMMTPVEVCFVLVSSAVDDIPCLDTLCCIRVLTEQRALLKQPWKEYTAEGGRKYWYNTETQKSSWEMPDAYKKALGIDSGPSTPAYVPLF